MDGFIGGVTLFVGDGVDAGFPLSTCRSITSAALGVLSIPTLFILAVTAMFGLAIGVPVLSPLALGSTFFLGVSLSAAFAGSAVFGISALAAFSAISPGATSAFNASAGSVTATVVVSAAALLSSACDREPLCVAFAAGALTGSSSFAPLPAPLPFLRFGADAGVAPPSASAPAPSIALARCARFFGAAFAFGVGVSDGATIPASAEGVGAAPALGVRGGVGAVAGVDAADCSPDGAGVAGVAGADDGAAFFFGALLFFTSGSPVVAFTSDSPVVAPGAFSCVFAFAALFFGVAFFFAVGFVSLEARGVSAAVASVVTFVSLDVAGVGVVALATASVAVGAGVWVVGVLEESVLGASVTFEASAFV